MKDLNTLIDYLITYKNIKLNVTKDNSDLITDVTGISIDNNGIATLVRDKGDVITININNITHIGIGINVN